MKLTQDIRRQMVNAIMADIPVIDHAGAMSKRAMDIAVAALPEPVRRLWNGPHKSFVSTGSVHFCCCSYFLPNAGHYDDRKALGQVIAADAEWSAAHAAFEAQRDAHKAMRAQLRANIDTCSTRKQFIDRFPALEKYAPALGTSVGINLPASTALIDSLISAGLPVEAQAA
jgi:hypothetical protein